MVRLDADQRKRKRGTRLGQGWFFSFGPAGCVFCCLSPSLDWWVQAGFGCFGAWKTGTFGCVVVVAFSEIQALGWLVYILLLALSEGLAGVLVHKIQIFVLVLA